LIKIGLCCLLALTLTPRLRAAEDKGAITGRAKSAASVLLEMAAADDKRIPEQLLEGAEAVAVFPGIIQGAAGVGGRYGKGLVSERLANGGWSSPVFLTIGGGSWGPQVGLASTDLVLVFTNADALRTVEEGAELKLGVDASMVAGPIGRSVEIGTDAKLQTAIYAYSRAKGLFAGIALDGAVLKSDEDSNRQIYGQDATARTIFLSETLLANEVVKPFMDALKQATLKKKVTSR